MPSETVSSLSESVKRGDSERAHLAGGGDSRRSLRDFLTGRSRGGIQLKNPKKHGNYRVLKLPVAMHCGEIVAL
ncbi:hypothetical protein CC1G_15220 [Coprinopsis cinerea okayama7|uniref:Uncharacterized protein n=1 Tax=Coprinopsis cinerea (strain Okayama-7 / 130 / ATCC MYA-4618 / FGSC 9003) TaxID=240176 RepID=D6RPT8_COPC7|nr:hypothetical protein CC1G_15220 [Coprinopsis cinerea okayama7\|eukprot:XP_002910585.1 hypothetical protein CC1G_15220 [Coprinopsis cinerea okayama7\